MNSRTRPRKALAERSDFIGAKTFSLTIRLEKKSNAKKKKKGINFQSQSHPVIEKWPSLS